MWPINLMWSDALWRIIKHMVLRILRLFSGSFPSVFPLKSVRDRALWSVPGLVSDAHVSVPHCWTAPAHHAGDLSVLLRLPHPHVYQKHTCSLVQSLCRIQLCDPVDEIRPRCCTGVDVEGVHGLVCSDGAKA